MLNLEVIETITNVDNSPMEIKFSQTTKMPWVSWDIPAWECITGSKLAKLENTVCSGCYATKGRYIFGTVKNANVNRFKQLETMNEWKLAFIKALQSKYKGLKDKNKAYFRWHTSGDLQSLDHLQAIVEIANELPLIKFWLPTKEIGIVSAFTKFNDFPVNLCVRVSMFKIDQIPSYSMNLPTSTVITDKGKNDDMQHHLNLCHASEETNGSCGDCRKCWDKNTSNVAYKFH